MLSKIRPQVEVRLAVHEEVSAFLVVRADDPEDWLARFDKTEGFPVREWAENMASIYNHRLERRSAGPPTREHAPPATIRVSDPMKSNAERYKAQPWGLHRSRGRESRKYDLRPHND